MRGESWRSLLHRDAMPTLLLRARLHPTFHVRRIARVEVRTPAEIIEDSPQLANITVHSSGSEVTGAPTLE